MSKQKRHKRAKVQERIQVSNVQKALREMEKEHNNTPNPHRITEADMVGSMVSAKVDEPSRTRPKNKVTAYTLSGKEDERVDIYDDYDESGYPRLFNLQKGENAPIVPAEDRDEAYAKRIVSDNGVQRYYVKTGRNAQFYNPIGLYDEGRHKKVTLGISEWQYSEVNKKAFLLYLDFLKTKNVRHLKQAEREAV